MRRYFINPFEFIKKHSKSLLLTAIFFFGGLLILTLAFDLIIMPSIANHGDEFILPDITGIDKNVASKKLEALKMNFQITSEEFHSFYPKGYVIAQVPSAGSNVKKNATVRVIVSKGAPSATVPHLKGISLREARLMIENAGLAMGEIVWFEDLSFPDGVVIESNPPAGTQLRQNSEVQLVVNRLGEIATVVVPALVGLDYAEAKDIIERGGLMIGEIKYKRDDRILPESVLSQSLAPGSTVPRWTKIDLIISKSE